MKKIIDGIRYDTAKATLIGSAESSYSRNDFHFWEESLYKAPRSGRFFITGEGGPMTRWSKAIDRNSWSGGSGIIAVEPDQARQWCEQYLEGDEWAVYFADQVQDA